MSTAHNDFRRAAGLAAWQDPELSGPGMFEVNGDDPDRRLITNVRRLAGTPSTPGSALISTAGWLLIGLAGGVLAVSYAGQFTYLNAARHQAWAANIEALMFDAGMIIFTLLALGLSMAGKPSRCERVLIMACSAGSAAMGYAAADVTSPRSVAAYVAPPIFLAVVVDRVIAVVRRHVSAGETSPWAGLGRVSVALLRLAGVLALYSLRLILAPRETPLGLRRMVLNATPLPGTTAPAIETPQPVTKKARLLALYENHPHKGDRSKVSAVASELGPKVGLDPRRARTDLYDAIDKRTS